MQNYTYSTHIAYKIINTLIIETKKYNYSELQYPKILPTSDNNIQNYSNPPARITEWTVAPLLQHWALSTQIRLLLRQKRGNLVLAGAFLAMPRDYRNLTRIFVLKPYLHLTFGI